MQSSSLCHHWNLAALDNRGLWNAMTEASSSPGAVQDGKKGQFSYCYFSNGMSAPAPLAPPKPLTDEEVAAQQEAAKQLNAQGSSAWNHAGTFEERDWTEWAKGRLKEIASDTTFTRSGCSVAVTGVTVSKGHANTWFVRGKQRHGFDFELSINWTITAAGKDIKGTAKIPNAACDELDELSVLEVESLDKSNLAAHTAAIKAVQNGLADHMSEILTNLFTELKQK